ncbi:acyl-CoA thioesterase [Breoghania sp.]|uniref:acyl-CoA thioesterase n=1 Tax=Breoghania sp. TaxID=2065378 RepID=UPI002AA6E828|nr:acyl-CoA thioesterase [Breoghania sp.]
MDAAAVKARLDENLSGESRAGETQFFELVLPEQTNHYGTLYGANALHLMGKAAFVCASRHARRTIVMAKSDAIDFRKPVKLGQLIDIRAHVVAEGRTSLTVCVNVIAEDLASGTRYPAINGNFVMVAVDSDGRPTPLAPAEIPQTDAPVKEEIHS